MSTLVQNGLDYESRLDQLRAKKEAQTQAKLRKLGYMNEDDYGLVLPPDDFKWQPRRRTMRTARFTDWTAGSKNFRSLLDCHPVYVDPMDALAGRYMFLLNRSA